MGDASEQHSEAPPPEGQVEIRGADGGPPGDSGLGCGNPEVNLQAGAWPPRALGGRRPWAIEPPRPRNESHASPNVARLAVPDHAETRPSRVSADGQGGHTRTPTSCRTVSLCLKMPNLCLSHSDSDSFPEVQRGRRPAIAVTHAR